nr:MAG TPA: hypothetical protein [Caudoviricetes sp.]
MLVNPCFTSTPLRLQVLKAQLLQCMRKAARVDRLLL